MIIFYKEVFEREGLSLWLKPYSIVSTSKTTGLIEVSKGVPFDEAMDCTPCIGSSCQLLRIRIK